jgi:hypothetical protein
MDDEESARQSLSFKLLAAEAALADFTDFDASEQVRIS